jgi:tRNA nucleotidyltransferase (CCA-adding enzyme)
MRDGIELVTTAAAKTAVPAWWVGGTVRDTLLGSGPARLDLDLAVEGAPDRLLAALEERGARVGRRSRFSTWELRLPSEVRLDVARTRTETYLRAGGLPDVAPASLAEDLARRDFTINAMALPTSGGPLVDPFDGARDLARRQLRTLHGASFRDDPTRILRGVRFEVRWSFRFDASTESAAREVIETGALPTVGADRLRRELEAAADEANLEAIVARWIELGIWRASFAGAPPSADRLVRRDLAPASGGWPRDAFWALLWSAATPDEVRSNLDRLGLVGSRAVCIATAVSHLREADEGALDFDAMQPAEWEIALLSTSPRPAVRALVERQRQRAEVRLEIDGNDLLRAGLRPGPWVGEALRQVLRARRDGLISAGEELEFAMDRALAARPR